MGEQLEDNAKTGGSCGKAVLHRITVQRVCEAYAASTQSQAKHWCWLFSQKYIDLQSLKHATATNNDSMSRVGESKKSYKTIEEAILDSNGEKASRYSAAADWCVATLKGENFRNLSSGQQKELLESN